MRSLAGILISVLFFAACDGNEEAKPPVSSNLPAPEKEMNDAIARFPDSFLLRENLVQYYRENGRYDLALAATENALKKDSTNTRLWDIKATLFFENEDTMHAIQAFEKAVALLPDPKYMMSLGVLYAETKSAKAIDIADALLISKKADAKKEALFIKGLYYNYTGEKQKAVSFFDRCLALNYSFMDAYREKAVALYDMENYEEALQVLEKAITLQNAFDEGHYWMGRCYEKLNRRNDAIQCYRLAIEAAQKNNDDNMDARQALERLGAR